MATKVIDRWVKELQQGTFLLSDIQRMEKLQYSEVLEHLSLVFPHKVLDRKLTGNQEVGLAQSSRTIGTSQREAQKQVAQVYHHCLFLTSDSGMLTGLTLMSKLRFRRSSSKKGAFELVSGYGASVFRDIDGWMLKVLGEKKIILSKDVLIRRGWLFASL